jgi:hypothetical protein
LFKIVFPNLLKSERLNRFEYANAIEEGARFLNYETRNRHDHNELVSLLFPRPRVETQELFVLFVRPLGDHGIRGAMGVSRRPRLVSSP